MINLYAPICNTGYGIAAYNILRALDKITEVTLFNVGEIDKSMPDSQTILKNWIASSPSKQSSFDNNSTTVKIWHQHELFNRIGKGKHYGFPIFELDKFTALELSSINSCDHLLVCSEWAKKIIMSNPIKSDLAIDVVPLGIDQEIFKPSRESRDKTIFFNCGKWEVRKGHDIVLECFERAFSSNDNVELWMMCHNPFPFARGEKWEEMYRSSKLYDKIKLIPRQPTQQSVYNILRQVDCGIFPARAEGWNLELLETMACGKNVITTNYSGHTEFCNSENARLIEIESLEPAIDNVWFHGQGNWAKIEEKQKVQIVDHLKDVHDKKQSGKLAFNDAGVETGKIFTWDNSAKKLMRLVS
jgi:glycosyltransferase involved in cell wall biosynthesis